MNDDVARWQQDARRAFGWIEKMYEQAQTVWDDARGHFEQEGWSVQCGNGFGGVSYSKDDLSNWPFIYFKVMGATSPNAEDKGPGGGAFFGFLFYDNGDRAIPACVAGTATWSNQDANCDHWFLLAAIGGAAPEWINGSVDIISRGPISTTRTTAKGKALRPGMEEVRWFELPLGSIRSPDRLREVIVAAMALHNGDDGSARKLVDGV